MNKSAERHIHKTIRRLLTAALTYAIAVMLSQLQPVLAWSDFGHEAVAYVCYQHLTPQARERVNALLKLNPMHEEWSKHCNPKFDKDLQIFMFAATWPDRIKELKDYVNEPADTPECYRNLGYSDRCMHKPWHYVDIPYSQDHTPLPKVPKPNAQMQLPKLVDVLKDRNADESFKSYDLVWVMHLVGDMHQPLHCINRACKDSPNGDNGGNDVKIAEDIQNPRLHRFVDYILGPDVPPEMVIPFAETHLGEPNKTLANERDIDKWIDESHQLAIKKVYRQPIGPENGPYTLTDRYRRTIMQLGKERVELAGVRLAKLLNGSLE